MTTLQKLVDIQNDEDGVKVWPLFVCAVLFASGVYILFRCLEGLPWAWFIGHQVVVYAFAYAMYRVQRYGSVWWNVQQTRRGFRVVLKEKK